MAPCVPRPLRIVVPRLALGVLLLFAASCGSSSSTSVTAPTTTRCGVSVSNTSSALPSAGGTGNLTINTERECAWTARAEASWVTLSGTEGQGPATLAYTVAPNAIGKQRRGSVQVGEQRVEIVQEAAPCEFDLNRTRFDVPSTGGDVDVALSATSGCGWTASSSNTWIGNAIPSSGEGSATVRFVVSANAGTARSGNVTIAGRGVTIDQAANTPTPTPPVPNPPTPTPPPPAPPVPNPPAPTPPAPTPPAPTPPAPTPPAPTPPPPTPPAPTPPPPTPPAPTPPPPAPVCTYTVSPESKSVARTGEEVVIAVTSPSGCTWTSSTSTSWIAITSGAGSGNGSVRLVVAANSGAPRTGTATIAGRTVTISQAGLVCNYTIEPASRTINDEAREVKVAVKVDSGCPWTAASDVGWIIVDSGRSGSGNGEVELEVEANRTGATRTGTVQIAGRVFTLTQEAAPAPAPAPTCSYSLKPTWYDAGRGPDDVTITVNTDPGCKWTTTNTASWVTVADGASGTGKGTVRLLVEANFGPARSTVLIIAGEEFTLRQAAR